MNSTIIGFISNNSSIEKANDSDVMLIAQNSQKPKQERREHERLDNLSSRLRVVDWQTEQELGRIADISLGGFCLTSKLQVPTQQAICVQIEIRMGSDYSKVMAVEARAVWQKNRHDVELYETGFYFTNLSADDGQRLQQLINILTFNNHNTKQKQMPLALTA